jgi:hypothetical protein
VNIDGVAVHSGKLIRVVEQQFIGYIMLSRITGKQNSLFALAIAAQENYALPVGYSGWHAFMKTTH